MWRLILEWSNLGVYQHKILGIAKLTCPIAEMSSIATLRDCHVQSIKFWIKLTYERSILINPVGLWKIEMVWMCLTYLFSYSASGKSFETLKFWNGNKTSNYKIFSIDVFGFDGSVTEWPGRVGVVICWSRVQTPTMLLSGFFFVCLVFACALFIANLNYFSISYNVLPLLDTFIVDWCGEPPA